MRQSKSVARLVFGVAAMMAVTIAGCNNNASQPGSGGSSGAMTINGAGATFPQPIYAKWFETYTQQHPDVKFNYQAVGSGAGISQYNAGTVDFGASDAPPTDAELKQPTVLMPTVAGAVVIAYNLPGAGPGLKLTGDVIADIFLGKITSWNDARILSQNPTAKLPATAITVAHRSDGSGTTFIFTNYLAAVSPAWKSGPGAGKTVNWPIGVGGNGNPGVAGNVRAAEGAIGYIELAYAIQNKLDYAQVQNKDGSFVTPTVDSTTAAAASGADAVQKDIRVLIVNGAGKDTYPIAGFTYLMVPKTPKDATKGKALVDFLKWAMSPAGQDLAKTLYYAPLPAAVAKINTDALDTIQVSK